MSTVSIQESQEYTESQIDELIRITNTRVDILSRKFNLSFDREEEFRQDCHLKVWEKRYKIDWTKYPHTYIYHICQNLLTSQYQKSQRQIRIQIRIDEIKEEILETSLTQKTGEASLEFLIEDLGTSQLMREAIKLRLEENSINKTAKLMGIHPNTLLAKFKHLRNRMKD